jgi:transposase
MVEWIMSLPTAALPMTDAQRAVLTDIAKSQTAPHREVQRAKALLMAADGVATSRVAALIDASPASVTNWRHRFTEEGLRDLGRVRPGRGRKPSIANEKVQAIVEATTGSKPDDATHWSCRSMARAQGVGVTTVHRIWSSRRLQPHRVDTFKLSTDPRFEEKLIDIVGLYLNPPDQAVVLCMDEKSQIQALDRTQRSLPMKPGRAGTMTHDYKRHGTTTLFAALNVLTGTVIGQCQPRHRHEEFLRFLRRIDNEIPTNLAIHMILDNYATHKHPDVRAWLQRHPRFNLHFTPTSASWLNLLERWFAELTGKRIRRGVFRSVPDLVTAIERYLAAYNASPKPFVWTATAEQIIAGVRRGRAALDVLEPSTISGTQH